mgnify:CR=1 FL=1
MSPDSVFALSNGLALLSWLALIFSPASAPWTRRVWFISGRAVPLLLSAGYLLMFALHWRGEGGFGSPAEVRALFDLPDLLVAGWMHYLAFDLFVGAWIAERAQRIGLPHMVSVPLLILTFMLGPVGFLSFMTVSAWRQRQGLSTHLSGESL